MFIRVKTTPNSPRRSIQIVDGYRVGKRVKQVIIAHVGVVTSDEEEVKLRNLAKTMMTDILSKKAKDAGVELSSSELASLTKKGRKSKKLNYKLQQGLEQVKNDFSNLIEEHRFNSGINDIAGAVFDSVFHGVLNSSKQMEILKNVTLSRMIYPNSKLKLCDILLEKFGVKYNEDQLYRMMDKLYPKINQIKQLAFNKTHDLMPNVNVLLFDVTTLYCESVMQDSLRDFGFSKDGKFNNTQLVLALATNDVGLPIGYELLPGNCAEVKTLLVAINSWSKIFNIKSACFIGDRAMFSEDNINIIEEHGYNYIIAAKLKSMPEDMQHKILNINNYKNIDDGRIAEFTYPYKKQVIKCSFNNNCGYVVEGTTGNITAIKYIVNNNVIYANVDEFKKLQLELNKLRSFATKCDCLLLTEEEYAIQTINNIAVVVGNNVIYNGLEADIGLLTVKEQEQLIKAVANNYIPNKLMSKLFSSYNPDKHINVPCEFIVKLFPHFKIPQRRLCVSYKLSRASNDAAKRERILTRLKYKQGGISNIIKTTARLYMNTTGNTKLDADKIATAELWDGIHGVLTNITTDSAQEILMRYSNLWRIEDAFRFNKHTLQMRPIYHFKAERIHSHIAICYMTFVILRLIQYQVQITKPQLKLSDILATLLKVEYSIYLDPATKMRYKAPGYMDYEAELLYQAFNVKREKRILLVGLDSIQRQ